MAPNQLFSNMTMRQKIVALLVVVVIIFLIWQVIGLFSNKNTATTYKPPAIVANNPGMPPGTNMPVITPQRAPLPKPAAPSPQEMQLLKLQQETEARYISALNQLQML